MTVSCLFTACGKSEGSSEIVGTWTDTEVEDIKFIFNSDGTWQYVSNGVLQRMAPGSPQKERTTKLRCRQSQA